MGLKKVAAMAAQMGTNWVDMLENHLVDPMGCPLAA
jgi:hypothetical protein